MSLSKSAQHQQPSGFLPPKITTVQINWKNIDLEDWSSLSPRFSNDFGTENIGLKLKLENNLEGFFLDRAHFFVYLVVSDKTQAPELIKTELLVGKLLLSNYAKVLRIEKMLSHDEPPTVVFSESVKLTVDHFEVTEVKCSYTNLLIKTPFQQTLNLTVLVNIEQYTDSSFWSIQADSQLKTANNQRLLTRNNSKHATVLCQQLSDAYERIETDVTLKTVDPDGSERLFDAHKFVLQMRSPFFAAMLVPSHFAEGHKAVTADKNSGDKDKGNKPEAKSEAKPKAKPKAKPVLELYNISGKVMEAMLDYFYGRPNDNWKSIACDLVLAAEMYQVPELMNACLDAMQAGLNTENAAQALIIADSVDAPYSVVKAIAKYIYQFEDLVKASEGWQKVVEDRGGEDWMEKLLDERRKKRKKNKRKLEEVPKDGYSATAFTSAASDKKK